MIGKILSHLLGNAGEESEAVGGANEELLEFEEGEWVIVNVPESGPLPVPDADPLENLLIEHPSMSVYQIRCRMEGAEEEDELVSDDDEEETSRPLAVRRHISWHLAAWGNPQPCGLQLLAMQRARSQAQRKKLSRSALHRHNMTKTQFSPKNKGYGNIRRPSQRLYNF
ncbi:tumor protein p53-inducible nuclear protein 2 [Poeciliopsis prolifica]|uniref:tumor protein p53-inducible nuclear protein 2 n=1 Tax=Poeciliopsis prolifica TaxID=188132 RepID=UPI002413FD86|nr:tumor protein p53-inducible nuclear protein 2 [Poeciliopsis prolifica]XP_054916101.1 tumor protein p53-inducible nuclear protein 2 [Poeciliopsis prolifica]